MLILDQGPDHVHMTLLDILFPSNHNIHKSSYDLASRNFLEAIVAFLWTDCTLTWLKTRFESIIALQKEY